MKANEVNAERLKSLQKQTWDIATKKGWHENPLSPEHYMGLIMTEMAEAVEADRNGRRADMESFNERMNTLDGSDDCFKEMYKRYVKGSIEEEFADVVIRILDMAQEIHGDKMQWTGSYPYGGCYRDDRSFIESAWYFIREFLNFGYMNITDSVIYMYDWSEHLGINLDKHIEWKMKYNELRPYKHGGKKY